MYNYSFGINLTFNIYDGGLRSVETDQAIIRKKVANLEYEGKKKEAVLDVEQAYLDLKTNDSILKSLAEQMISAKENYESVNSF